MHDALSEAKEELAYANRILFRNSVLDAFGHVSMRHPTQPDRFLLARNLAPARVTPGDILEFDLEANCLSANAPAVYLERFIHAAIFARNPTVAGVVHSHSPSVLPFTIARKARLQPVCHMAGFLRGTVPNFEIREAAGNSSDLLIRNVQLGHALADKLDGNAVILMRGHGITVLGESVKQAVFRAVYVERNAKIQMQALALGEIEGLNDDEAAAADAANTGQIARAWDFWLSEVDAA